jgi:hypothetical protein
MEHTTHTRLSIALFLISIAFNLRRLNQIIRIKSF